MHWAILIFAFGTLLQSQPLLGEVQSYVSTGHGSLIDYVLNHGVGGGSHPPQQHPLDPLLPEEIQETVTIIRAILRLNNVQGDWVFNWITLHEPEKHLLLPYFLNDESPPTNSPQIPRRSFTTLLDRNTNTVVEVVTNLFTRTVESWTGLPKGTQPMFSLEDSDIATKIGLSDPRVLERCREMGWTNTSLIHVSTWSIPFYKDQPELANAVRPILLFLTGKLSDLDNRNAHPFDFDVVVDIIQKKVLAIQNMPTHNDYDANNRQGNVCPKTPHNYDPELKPAGFYRTDLHPIKFSQPGGASFQVNGNEVTWQKFKFRLGFNAREGMIIHQVSYKDGDEHRPLFYRLSVAEVFVPYADPRPPFHQKFTFDEGEFGLFFDADQDATRICEGGGVAAFMTYYMNNEKGEARLVKNAVCIQEEDRGLLWAHWGDRFVHTRSQRLTVTFFANEGGYDYKFAWHFYQDATIEFTCQLFGRRRNWDRWLWIYGGATT